MSNSKKHGDILQWLSLFLEIQRKASEPIEYSFVTMNG